MFLKAVEDRSQHKNRASALARLRTLLALKGKFANFNGHFPIFGFLENLREKQEKENKKKNWRKEKVKENNK